MIGSSMVPDAPEGDGSVLFSEPGARWRVIAYGPILCLVVLIFELVSGSPAHWLTLAVSALVLAGIVRVQVLAARRHVSVELTATTLRQGTEDVDLSEIVEVFPEPDEDRRDDELWESARALGELTDVPRGRRPIGLRLDNGMLVRAWAKNDEELRVQLTSALARRGTGTGDK